MKRREAEASKQHAPLRAVAAAFRVVACAWELAVDRSIDAVAELIVVTVICFYMCVPASGGRSLGVA